MEKCLSSYWSEFLSDDCVRDINFAKKKREKITKLLQF